MEKNRSTVTEADSGIRLDVFLARTMNTSRGEAQRILEAGLGKVNGREAKANCRLREGDVVEIRDGSGRVRVDLAEMGDGRVRKRPWNPPSSRSVSGYRRRRRRRPFGPSLRR